MSDIRTADVEYVDAVQTGNDEILDVEAGCTYLKVSLPTFMELIKSGQLKAARVGRQWRIRKVWIHEFLDAAAASAA